MAGHNPFYMSVTVAGTQFVAADDEVDIIIYKDDELYFMDTHGQNDKGYGTQLEVLEAIQKEMERVFGEE